MKKKGNILSICVFLLGILLLIWFMIPVCTSGLLNLGNGFGISFSIFILIVTVLVSLLHRHGKEKIAKVIAVIGITIASCIVVWAGSMTALMISGMVSQPHASDATVIVLGCKVRGDVPSTHLARRIEAAARYLHENPAANCVASGGKGSDEIISEAQMIYDLLVADGIAEERIIKEESSTNTRENLLFSKALIASQGWNTEVVLVTDDFHQYRANRIAKQLGISSSPVNAKHTWHTFPANYARELLAITKELLT